MHIILQISGGYNWNRLLDWDKLSQRLRNLNFFIRRIKNIECTIDFHVLVFDEFIINFNDKS